MTLAVLCLAGGEAGVGMLPPESSCYSSLSLRLPPSPFPSLLSPNLPPIVFAASPPGDVNSAFIENVPMNQPAVLDCGPIQSVPPTTYDWEFSDGFPISPIHDNAIIGIDGLLYLQLVEMSLQFIELSHTFLCTANNRYTQGSQSGYIQVSVEGKSLEHCVITYM